MQIVEAYRETSLLDSSSHFRNLSAYLGPTIKGHKWGGSRTLGLKWDQTLLRHKSNSEVVCLRLSKGKVPLPGCSSPSIPWGKSSCSQRLQKAAACSGTQGQLPQMPESCKQFAFHIQAPCRAGVGIPSIQKSANIPDTSGVVILGGSC